VLSCIWLACGVAPRARGEGGGSTETVGNGASVPVNSRCELPKAGKRRWMVEVCVRAYKCTCTVSDEGGWEDGVGGGVSLSHKTGPRELFSSSLEITQARARKSRIAGADRGFP
jgi:hypothetical protein